MKKYIVFSFLILFLSCNKQEDPNPQKDNSEIIGVWQVVKGRTYTQNANGTISDDEIHIANDTVNNTECITYEYTTSGMVNSYIASFYEAWNKDTLFVVKNDFSYKITGNKIMLGGGDEWEIVSLTNLDMVLRNKQDEDEGDIYMIETTYKKLKGNTFKDFIFVP